MATKRQNSTATRIELDKAQARFNRVNLEYQKDPDDTRKRNAYRKAKTDLAVARTTWRAYRDAFPDSAGDAVAEVTSIGATTTIT